MSRPTAIVIRNDTPDLLGVYVEPYPNDYWLRPAEAIRVVGNPGAHDVDIIRFASGLTVVFGADPDPEVWSLDGVPLESGHQRPEPPPY